MPIVDAPLICKGPMVALGYGDVYLCHASSKEGDSKRHYILFYEIPSGGAIGLAEETGRKEEEPIPDGGHTGTHPANVAICFDSVKSLDALAGLLQVTREAMVFTGIVGELANR